MSRRISDEQVRICTYVILGITLGIVIVALFIDGLSKSKTSLPLVPVPHEQETKEQATHEQNLTGAQ